MALDITNVLIIDDEEDIIGLIKAVISKEGFNVFEATSVEEALRILKTRPIDLVLSDIHIPGPDGIEVLRLVSKMPPPIPRVIYITGDGEFDPAEARAAGAFDLLYKPISKKALLETIRKLHGSILVADKDQGALKSLVARLEEEKFFVKSCTDQTHLSEHIKHDYFDILIMGDRFIDDTKEIVKEIRNKYNENELPIIISSPGETQTDLKANEFIVAGANDYLPKIMDVQKNIPKLKSLILIKRNDKNIQDSRDKAVFEAKNKAQFLASMSHEIRTPLNGVVGLMSLLTATKLDAEQKTLVSLMQSSSERLLTVLNDILDLSKIEAGKIELDDRAFEIRPAIKEVTEVARTSLDSLKKKVDLILEFDENLPEVVIGDKIRAQQILSNFLTNAVKFTKEGHIKVVVKLISQKLQLVQFEVHDTGIGLKTSETKKLFKSFSQADVSIYRRYGGTGLGLSICKKLASLMGGNVGVTSRLGKGSTFWFNAKLPVPSEADQRQFALKNQSTNPDPALQYRGKKILIVDDDMINRKVASKLVSAMGCEFVTAESGYEALEAAKEHKFDLILLDCQMPKLDGYTTASMLREQHGSGCPTIVALTADAYKDNENRCKEAGMDDFISKPVSITTMQKVLERNFKVK